MSSVDSLLSLIGAQVVQSEKENPQPLKKGVILIRKTRGVILLLFILFLSAFVSEAVVERAPLPASRPQDKPAAAVEPSFDEIAALIAGIQGEVPALAAVRETAVWKRYAEAIDKNWADLEGKRLKPMRAWADKELFKVRTSAKIVFYPFGGPDFMTAFEFFPNAEAYVLLGLEFCGRLPSPGIWKGRPAEAFLKNFSSSLSDFFDKSYFITKHMDETLYGQGQVEGVLPLLCFFLKRTGHRVLDIGRIEFSAAGEPLDVNYDKGKKASRPGGLRIRFSADGSEDIKSLIYFSCDLENKKFTKDSPLYSYLNRLPSGLTTFIKSAQYLLQSPTFSHVREMILSLSRFILQDDTGIPYKSFKTKEWRVLLYGEYAKPIRDFSGVDQPDLKKAYEDSAAIIDKLPFHLGYHWQDNRDALLLIVKKPEPRS
jgi:hypothetical protein